MREREGDTGEAGKGPLFGQNNVDLDRSDRSDSRFNGARAGGGERGEGLERGERCPIIRIIDDSFPAYDRERLIGRNGVKSRASCRASFCHPRPGEDRSFLAATLPSILSRARF